MALLPFSFPLHPSQMWCYCRTVYCSMSYLYGIRFQVICIEFSLFSFVDVLIRSRLTVSFESFVRIYFVMKTVRMLSKFLEVFQWLRSDFHFLTRFLCQLGHDRLEKSSSDGESCGSLHSPHMDHGFLLFWFAFQLFNERTDEKEYTKRGNIWLTDFIK